VKTVTYFGIREDNKRLFTVIALVSIRRKVNSLTFDSTCANTVLSARNGVMGEVGQHN
jgi:hypothetical protein